MTKNNLKRIALKKIKAGKTRQAALTEIREETRTPLADIAKILQFIPSKQTREKYKAVNAILLGLLILTILSKLLIGISIVIEKGIQWLPILLIIPLINVLLAYGVATYKGDIYRWIAVLPILSLLKSSPEIIAGAMALDVFTVAELVLAGAIIFFGFYLKGKFASDAETRREYYINDSGERRGRDIIFFRD